MGKRESVIEAPSTLLGSAKAASCAIVGVGASAGGLEAMRQLFAALPPDTGAAFVVIQHLDPSHPSLLTTVLGGDTQMPVVEVEDGMRAEPDRVHVIPPGFDLGIAQGILQLLPRPQERKLHLPIDSFFRALADDQPGKAMGVVLSGSASDGTDGLRAIKSAGGITFAQEPESAQFPSMPKSAIAAGVVDRILAPQEIAGELARLSRHPYHQESKSAERTDGAAAEGTIGLEKTTLSSALSAVRRHTHLDFSGYKRPTIMRRLERRMALRGLDSLDQYADSLGENAQEARALAEDILIHVTSFFRDPAAFEALKEHVLPELLKHKEAGGTLRIWVPGCSTGEEVYSIAICLLEVLAEQRQDIPVKIFGSDLSNRAIEIARSGRYSTADLEGVEPERLAQFFERSESSYRIAKRIRELCIFVQHDLTSDPPFAKLDLISCRNLLIYFDTELQRRILPTLHYCLNNPGYLFLGQSEALPVRLADLFVPVVREQRLFLKAGESPRLVHPVAIGREAESRLPNFRIDQRLQPAREAQKQADILLLARFAPSGVVINERLEVVQFRGHTGDFLEAPPGLPQTHVVRMAREGISVPLREAIEAVKANSVTARGRGEVTDQGRARPVSIEVTPLAAFPGQTERHFLVLFEFGDGDPQEAAEGPKPAPTAAPPAKGPITLESARLSSELASTKAYLQAITSEHQDVLEDLAATNAEFIAANEELQSTNEELQSAKEELQSSNEELITVNEELRFSNRQLDVLANDVVNILESVQIPVIIVDQALRVRRFTPVTREISSLIPADVGRPIEDVKIKVKVDDLTARIRATIDTNTPSEGEVQGLNGRWFRLNIRPYRTSDNRLDGAILSFVDIDALKHAIDESEHARVYAQGIVETVPIPLLVLDQAVRVVSANPAFYRIFSASLDSTEGGELFHLASGAWDEPTLRQAIARSAKSGAPFSALEIRCTFPGNDQRQLLVDCSPIPAAAGASGRMLLLAVEDITQRRMLEASERQAKLEAENANRAKDLFLATLSHELRTPLSTIMLSAQVLETSTAASAKAHGGPKDEEAKILRACAAIQRAVAHQARLIDDLLDISRIVSGKLIIDLRAADLAGIVRSAIDVAQGAIKAKGIALECSIQQLSQPVFGDADRLQQVVANLLNNSTKFTPRGGKIWVGLVEEEGKARLTIRDTGIGVAPGVLPHLFDRFVQAESSMTRAHGGLGLGLAIVRHLVEVHGGEVVAQSPGEQLGATFTVTLPLAAHDSTVIADEAPSVARSIRGTSVLIIDDDPDTRYACQEMLETMGAKVKSASSAAEGLSLVEPLRPEVILCDIAMPGEDGYSFIRKLRQLPPEQGGATPAAAVTALAGEEDRKRALEAGFDLHVNKPVDAARLAVTVRALAGAPKPSADAGGPGAAG